jgi:hypothetical protein
MAWNAIWLSLRLSALTMLLLLILGCRSLGGWPSLVGVGNFSLKYSILSKPFVLQQLLDTIAKALQSNEKFNRVS